ncbi:hypothetical protein MMC10_008363 [Thelotrema lepadinum]|nr:hypothetical protein [Thelotrema lepadinum]
MPPTPSAEDAAQHQALLDSLDIAQKPRPFRNTSWKPSQRRNKNVKQIIGEAARKEASVLATQNNSGTTTPAVLPATPTPGASTPTGTGTGQNIAQAAQSLGQLVLEKNLQASIAAGSGAGGPSASAPNTTGSATLGVGRAGTPARGGTPALGRSGTPGLPSGGGIGGIGGSGPVATYTNIESAPSLHPAHQKPYCDITGLPAPYRDPKTRLRYCNKEVFAMVRGLPQGQAEVYLAARNAHVILK